MYKIKFINNKGEVITTKITNKKDLNKIGQADAKNSIIDCQIGSGMPVLLHNAITKHNSGIRSAVDTKL